MKNISLYQILFEATEFALPAEYYEKQIMSKGFKIDPRPNITNVQELNIVNSARADLARKITEAKAALLDVHKSLGNPKSVPDYNRLKAAYNNIKNQTVISQDFIRLVESLLKLIEHRQSDKSKMTQN